MKPSLQLNVTQQLKLTPQMQQAIRLLQLSTTDLRQEIQQQLESNPMLEATPITEEDILASGEHFEHENEFDYQWASLYSNEKQKSFNENDYIYETLHCTTTNLQDHLRWQLNLTPMSDVDRGIAATIIDAIDDRGFLSLTIQDIHASLTQNKHPLDIKEVEAVLHRIQRFDPVGCAVSSLSETLSIQVEQLPQGTPHLELIHELIANDLEKLGRHENQQLLKKYKIDDTTLNEALQSIQSLNPNPGSVINRDDTEYVVPDLTVKKKGGQWEISLNQSLLPCLHINTYYASFIKRANNSKDNLFLKTNLQEARWLLKSLQSRQETLLNVARYIIEFQSDFLENGAQAMKPLTLDAVSSALDIHESTVSRVTTQKFIYTPHGLFELKYFFSSQLPNSLSESCSSTAVRAFIEKIVGKEDEDRPLSDNKICNLLGAQGIQIARRTVAKYREELGIPPSYERKMFRR